MGEAGARYSGHIHKLHFPSGRGGNKKASSSLEDDDYYSFLKSTRPPPSAKVVVKNFHFRKLYLKKHDKTPNLYTLECLFLANIGTVAEKVIATFLNK